MPCVGGARVCARSNWMNEGDVGRSNVYLITLWCTTIYPCIYRRLAPSRLLFLDRSDGALSIFPVRDSKRGFILIRGRVYLEVIHTSSGFCMCKRNCRLYIGL